MMVKLYLNFITELKSTCLCLDLCTFPRKKVHWTKKIFPRKIFLFTQSISERTVILPNITYLIFCPSPTSNNLKYGINSKVVNIFGIKGSYLISIFLLSTFTETLRPLEIDNVAKDRKAITLKVASDQRPYTYQRDEIFRTVRLVLLVHGLPCSHTPVVRYCYFGMSTNIFWLLHSI